MPPKIPVIHQPSISPPPAQASGDAQDILIIQDFMDTLDQIPPELTRVHSDLNELGAVLYSTLVNLEKKLNTLIDWIQNASIGPEQRFQLLQEIAEEAARYKLGGDDKIRVAGGACDGIMAHQRHISNLLTASTLLHPSQASPYTHSLTLANLPPPSNTRRGVLSRAANSPFGARGYAQGAQVPALAAAGPSGDKERDTPTKKKKSRVQQLGMGREDDEVSSAGGKDIQEKKKVVLKKRKPMNRASSPAESLGSTSAFTAKPAQPQTARQLAAAANKARKVEQDDGTDDESRDEGPERNDGILGLDIGSREGSHVAPRSVNATPVLANAAVMGSDKGRSSRARNGAKRSRDEDDDEESDIEDDDTRPSMKRNGSTKKSLLAFDMEMTEPDPLGVDTEVDSTVYCTCRQVGYGEMIGCDDDECEIEWYHLACLGLDKTPEGNWICPQCVERRKIKAKKPPKGAKGRAK